MSDTLDLHDGVATARVALHGAELRAWHINGVPLIWTPDPHVWAETAPVLFPVVGWTRDGTVQVEGRTYPLGLHGFARALPFELAARGADWARLRLASSAETLRLYPFAFTLEVTYALCGPALRTELVVSNPGPAPFPYACGLHPGFCWPFAGGDPADYAIAFGEVERPEVPVISDDGLFTWERRPVPLEGRHLDLSDALFEREALCFLQARSRTLRFHRRHGPALVISLEGFPHIALWSRPGGRFLSVEAWTGHGDTVDSDGDLWRKPSMIPLPPGGMGAHAATYTFAAAAARSFPSALRDKLF